MKTLKILIIIFLVHLLNCQQLVIFLYKLEVFYAPEFTKTSAEERCKNGSNSTQEPTFGKKSTL